MKYKNWSKVNKTRKWKGLKTSRTTSDLLLSYKLNATASFTTSLKKGMISCEELACTTKPT
jgi:hypothetical protein